MSVNHQVYKHSGYEAAHSGAAFFIYPSSGYLRISGEDRLDFVQRQTTNDVISLQPNWVLMSVLTSPNARILDVLYLFIDEGNSLGLITLPGNEDNTNDFLKKRIFFKDKVSLSNLSLEYLQLDVGGPLAHQALSRIGIECPAEFNGLADGELNGEKLKIFKSLGFVQNNYRLLIRSNQHDNLIDALGSVDVVDLVPEEYEILRIESGIPAARRELSEEYTPLEVNLENAISMNKGCYTGQEVIARQINYDKIIKKMVGLRLKDVVTPNAQILVDGKQVGEITSTMTSPQFGVIALALLKRPYHEPETPVEVLGESSSVRGYVCRLPFSGPPGNL